MRIAVTGRNGQVATALRERATARHEILAIGRPVLDLAGDHNGIVRTMIELAPDVIISAAAYTAVDNAESDQSLAFAVNVQGAEAVAHAARQLDVPLLHLSTDYVFDGTKGTPYVETDPVSPINVYGETKLEGERAVLDCHDNVAILRTSWVYSPFGDGFLQTMIRLAADRGEIPVVSDQFANPTSAFDIAEGLLRISENLCQSDDPALRGIFHLAGTGIASRAEFAAAVLEVSASVGGPTAHIRPIQTRDYPTPARRPANSSLDCSKLQLAHGVSLPSWKSSMPNIVKRVVGENGPRVRAGGI